MKNHYLISILAIVILYLQSCTDLDVRPNSAIVMPKSVDDFEQLLNNESVTLTAALPTLHADEFLAPDSAAWQYWPSLTQRNAYIWKRDLYEGENNIPDWNEIYKGIFYCNSVLDNVDKVTNNEDRNRLKGWALFARAYLLYDLVINFAPGYDPSTADETLGIPLKLSANIDDIQPRATLNACYDQIFKDLELVGALIDQQIPAGNRNRPSTTAVHAFLARIYLQIGDYAKAEDHANRALSLFNTLTDFNVLDTATNNPFIYNTPETIYFSRQVYGYMTYGVDAFYEINPELFDLYHTNDLRRKIYFRSQPNNRIEIKPINTFAGQPFTGLAVDELYLIQAECLARRGDVSGAMLVLNTMMETRYATDSFTPMSASHAEEALEQVFIERRRALVYRNLRWQDLKRFNREGYNISLTRTLGGSTYTLPSNDSRYVFPIPADEVAQSGIRQNER